MITDLFGFVKPCAGEFFGFGIVRLFSFHSYHIRPFSLGFFAEQMGGGTGMFICIAVMIEKK